jgi:drug/metabolite transporter (DMT)-like permease
MIALVMLVWAVNYIATKAALREFDALTLPAFRITLAAVLLAPVYLLRGARREISRSDAVKFAQLGLFGVVLNQMFFNLGLSMTSVSHSALLIGLGPVYVLLLAWTQGLETIGPQKVAGMLLAFAGVATLGAEHGFNLKSGTLAGDLLTMGGSLAFSFYVVLGKKVARHYHPVEMNFFNYAAAAVMILPLTLRQGLLFDWRAVSLRGWLGLFYTAAFASVAAYLIYFWALRHVTASRIAAFSYLLPVMATGLGIVLLGERPTMHLLVGGVLVLLGVYLAETAASGDKMEEQEKQTV